MCIMPPAPPTTGLANPQQWAKRPRSAESAPLECAFEEASCSTQALSTQGLLSHQDEDRLVSALFTHMRPALTQGLHQLFSFICCSQGLLSPAMTIVPPTPPTTGLANPQQWAKCSTDNRARKPPAMGEVPPALLRAPHLGAHLSILLTSSCGCL
jgi:hypothetical protein